MNNVNKIKYKCIGCGLCENICPKNCIKIRENTNIGIRPSVNEELCIDCDLCIDLCPVSEIKYDEDLSELKAVYVGKSKEKKIRKNSSSGGIVSSTILNLFNKDKIDAAVVAFYDEKMNIYGDIITSEDEVLNHSGSYYHTSKMLINISKIKEYESLLFVGLPCQNVALENYINKYSLDNIYAQISLFCTIGRMKNGFDDFLKKNKIDIGDKVIYKSRYGEYRPGNIIIESKDKKYSISYNNNKLLRDKDYYYVPNGCLNCKKLFGIESSDLSVGDAWHFDNNEKTAIISCNSPKGEKILLNNEKLVINYATKNDLINSQTIGYNLKYKLRSQSRLVIKMLKFFYRYLPKTKFIKKVLNKFRGYILSYIIKHE
jgi:coenzyme F420-reducing hydrogenase beta subunit